MDFYYPGHENERDQVIYWQVMGTSVEFSGCSDEDRWQGDIEPPRYADNTFLIYRLSEDGDQAINQDCESTLPSSCQDSNIVPAWKVDGNTLSFTRSREALPMVGSVCGLGTEELWQVEDNGETAEFNVILTFVLEGEANACAQLDQDIKDSAPNGQGMDGCEVTLGVDLQYYPSDFPIIRAVAGQR